jgi:peptidoglycan/LPS O-acetylase OafA/YrhL
MSPDSAHRWLYRTPTTRLLDFALGIVTAIYFMQFGRAGENTKGWAALTVLAIGAVAALNTSATLFQNSYSWQATYAIPFAAIIVSLSLAPSSVVARALSAKPMLLLGEASYAFYLIHALLLPLYSKAPGGISAHLYYVLFLTLVVCASIGLHIAIEKPCRRFLRSFAGRGPM